MRTSKKRQLYEQINKELDSYRNEIDPIIKQMIDNKEINFGCWYIFISTKISSFRYYSKLMDKLTSAKSYKSAWNSISIWEWNYVLTTLRENRKNAEQFIEDIKNGKVIHGKYGYTYEQIKAMEARQ